MRKNYPWLQDSYYEDKNSQMRRLDFLKLIDEFVNQKQYVKITLLNWNEEPLKNIEGELTSGTISKDGSSSVRRTCTLSASIDGNSYDLRNAEMDYAINKKIFLEIGIKNYSKYYREYPILWFPQGVFFISNFSMNSSSTSAVNISLTLKDKMCCLNGEIGGKFGTSVILDEVDTQTPSGAYISEKVPIYNLIQELVHHWGGEDLNNIVIEDVPLRIKRVLKWSGGTPLYLIELDDSNSDSGEGTYQVSVTKPEDMQNVTTITNGYDAGYIYDDFYYTSEFTVGPSDTVCTALDRIKNYLGNYEYFYDEMGVFHFREIKNYLNNSLAKSSLEDMSENHYLIETSSGKTSYSFSDDSNLISITNTPRYENIANDFIVQGTRQMTSINISYPVRYHVAIDNKPPIGNYYYDLLLYMDELEQVVKAIFPLKVANLPEVGDFNLIYRIEDGDKNNFYYWDSTNLEFKEVNVIKYYPPKISSSSESYVVKDWRTELYLQGLLSKNNGTDAGRYYNELQANYTNNQNITQDNFGDWSWIKSNFLTVVNQKIDVDYYFEELEAFWPQIYDLENQKFYGETEDQDIWYASLTDGNYYLDFIEPTDSFVGQFSVRNIGRRTNVTIDDEINCLFQPVIPDIVFINTDDDDAESRRAECQLSYQPFVQIGGDIFAGFFTGGYRNGAFDQMKMDMKIHTNYAQTISIVALPVFYLEPNTRVQLNDKSTNTYGDYMVQTISIPLGAGNTMSCTLNECVVND